MWPRNRRGTRDAGDFSRPTTASSNRSFQLPTAASLSRQRSKADLVAESPARSELSGSHRFRPTRPSNSVIRVKYDIKSIDEPSSNNDRQQRHTGHSIPSLLCARAEKDQEPSSSSSSTKNREFRPSLTNVFDLESNRTNGTGTVELHSPQIPPCSGTMETILKRVIGESILRVAPCQGCEQTAKCLSEIHSKLDSILAALARAPGDQANSLDAELPSAYFVRSTPTRKGDVLNDSLTLSASQIVTNSPEGADDDFALFHNKRYIKLVDEPGEDSLPLPVIEEAKSSQNTEAPTENFSLQ